MYHPTFAKPRKKVAIVSIGNLCHNLAHRMSTPGSLLYPYKRLIKITVEGREFLVPENNTLLRGFQFLALEEVSLGPFCWNQHCQTCRVEYDLGKGTKTRAALACKTVVKEGMRITSLSADLRYRLRDVK